MTRRTIPRVAATCGLAALAALVGLTPASAHRSGDQPKRIWAGTAGLFVRATGGSFCWHSPSDHPRGAGVVCADFGYPLRVRGRLPVDPRDRITLLIPDHARRVRVRLLHVGNGSREDADWTRLPRRRSGWSTRAERVGENRHRWRFRLPANLGGANRLEAFVRYPRGDQRNFWAGLDAAG